MIKKDRILLIYEKNIISNQNKVRFIRINSNKIHHRNSLKSDRSGFNTSRSRGTVANAVIIFSGCSLQM